MTNQKIKWNWGTKLVVAMAAFILMLISFAVFMMRQDFSLVEKDYYPKGQAYQEMIEKERNAHHFDDEILAWLEDEVVCVSFPSFFEPELVSGTIHFYNRVNHEFDFFCPLQLDEGGVFHHPVSELNGRYILKIDWVYAGVSYHTEKTLTLP